ncbi:hypothetical protein GQ53DRAFT_817181 [Thozetella sp. PMI_491]|nr:hypothetical protein GQ53DRAFT_817181 [Thozetella sp. PMI_491]
MQLKDQGGAADSWDESFGCRCDLGKIVVNQTELEFLRGGPLLPPASEVSQGDSVEQDEDTGSDDDTDASETGESEISEDDDIETFLRSEGTTRLSTSSIQIKRFCKGATLAGLEGIGARGGKIWKGSIDDIRRDNKSIYRGVLNAGKFRDELAKPRFQEARNKSAENPSQAPQSEDVVCADDIERRVLYMPNPDRWCLLSLFLTTVRLEAPPLKEFVEKHLIAEASMGLTRSSRGFKTFTLHMQLPYFALRYHKKLKQDHRAGAEGKPFKQSKDLQFLNQSPKNTRTPAEFPCLYEAQISIAITGIDNWRWSAWAFADAFFDKQESAQHYHDETMGQERPDPLMRGLSLFYKEHEQDPRKYFLAVCCIWVKKIEDEWRDIIRLTRETVEQFDHRSPLFLKDNKPEEARTSFEQTEELLTQLRSCLMQTMSASGRFLEEEADNFYLSDRRDLRQKFSRLRPLLDQLEDQGRILKEKRETHFSRLQAHLAHQVAATAESGQKIAESGQKTSEFLRDIAVSTSLF